MDAPARPADARAPLQRPSLPRALLVRGAWTLGTAAALVLVLRTFVGDVYHVDSGSMEPTIWGAEGGGEWVFVRYTDAAPTRQELVVAQRPADDAPIVKRVLGLPGETVQIAGGDVLVGGRRIAAADPRPPWIVVYEQGDRPLGERFPVSTARKLRWRADGAVAELDAQGEPTDAKLGLLYFHDALRDDYLGPDGELVRGSSQVSDARFECDAVLRDVGARMRVGLSEQGDTFQAVITALADGACEVEIERRTTDAEVPATLARARVDWPLGARRRVAFQNRDNVLRVEVEGAVPVSAAYHENTYFPTDSTREGRSIGYRVWFGGEAGRFTFARVRVLRDLSYTDRGAFGVGAPCELGPDEYFVLGDHSSQSRDSREWGPIRAADVVGRPVAVVWPPSRWRRLRALADGVESGS